MEPHNETWNHIMKHGTS